MLKDVTVRGINGVGNMHLSVGFQTGGGKVGQTSRWIKRPDFSVFKLLHAFFFCLQGCVLCKERERKKWGAPFSRLNSSQSMDKADHLEMAMSSVLQTQSCRHGEQNSSLSRDPARFLRCVDGIGLSHLA